MYPVSGPAASASREPFGAVVDHLAPFEFSVEIHAGQRLTRVVLYRDCVGPGALPPGTVGRNVVRPAVSTGALT